MILVTVRNDSPLQSHTNTIQTLHHPPVLSIIHHKQWKESHQGIDRMDSGLRHVHGARQSILLLASAQSVGVHGARQVYRQRTTQLHDLELQHLERFVSACHSASLSEESAYK